MGKAAEDVHKSDMTAQVAEPSGHRRTRHVLSVSEASECHPHARFIHAYGAGGRLSLPRVRGVALTSVIELNAWHRCVTHTPLSDWVPGGYPTMVLQCVSIHIAIE